MKLYILFRLLFFAIRISAQENCATSLKKAQKQFETGNIEAIESLILPCISKGFSKEEKMEAYKLLINSSLFNDNIAKAEEYMLKFLKLDPEYKINKAIDGAEFIHLFQSYNTKPICLIGAGFGTNISYVRIKETYSVYSLNQSEIAYSSPGPGINAFIGLNIPITEIIDVNIDFQFVQNKFEYKNVSLNNQILFAETMTKIGIPVSVSYSPKKINKIKPYVFIGLSPGIIIGDKADINRKYLDNSHNGIAGSGINIISLRNKNLLDLSLGFGLNYNLKKGHIGIQTNFDIGLSKITDGSNKNAVNDLVYKYHYIDPDLFLNNLIFRAGYYYPLYNLKKKKK